MKAHKLFYVYLNSVKVCSSYIALGYLYDLDLYIQGLSSLFHFTQGDTIDFPFLDTELSKASASESAAQYVQSNTLNPLGKTVM